MLSESESVSWYMGLPCVMMASFFHTYFDIASINPSEILALAKDHVMKNCLEPTNQPSKKLTPKIIYLSNIDQIVDIPPQYFPFMSWLGFRVLCLRWCPSLLLSGWRFEDLNVEVEIKGLPIHYLLLGSYLLLQYQGLFVSYLNHGDWGGLEEIEEDFDL